LKAEKIEGNTSWRPDLEGQILTAKFGDQTWKRRQLEEEEVEKEVERMVGPRGNTCRG